MNLNRSQRRLLGVIGASAAALLVDKLILSPGDIQAATVAPPSATATPGLSPFDTEIPQEKAHAGSELAVQFDALAAEHEIDVDSIGNAFLAPADWLPEGSPLTTDVIDPDAMDFADVHELKGVMALGNAGYAMIDDRRLKIGDKLDGYQLTSIGTRSATFVNDRGHEVVLELKR